MTDEEKIAAWVERECRAWRCRGDVDESEAQAVEVLGDVLSSGIKAGEWRKCPECRTPPDGDSRCCPDGIWPL